MAGVEAGKGEPYQNETDVYSARSVLFSRNWKGNPTHVHGTWLPFSPHTKLVTYFLSAPEV